MRINTNIAALNSYNQLKNTQNNLSKSLERLSSGKRINRAADDAAGLAISEKMLSQTRGLAQAQRNAQDGISMIQTAEGALKESHSILQRMRELSVQSANDTNTEADRIEIQKEVDQLGSELKRISDSTEFNTKKLLNGDMGKIAQKTGGTGAVLSNLQASGADLESGSYKLTMTAAGTDTFTASSGATAVSAGDLTAEMGVGTGQNIKYGSYTLNVSSYDGTGNTANLELVGPDGETSTQAGVSTNTGSVSIGGIDINVVNENITGDGTVKFDLTANGLDVDLSGDKTVDSSAITAYDGSTLNVGGFEFDVLTNHGSTSNNADYTVIDKSVKFQIGSNKDQSTSLSINNMSDSALGVDGIDVTNQAGANAAIETLDDAISKVSGERSKLGAAQNRLEHTINNLNTAEENLTAAESRISDVDMAKEMMSFTKSQILSQAGTAMMAQANQLPQGVLQLLG
ncbi:flagellin [Halanaerobium congolense]|jgi:flagellin|uniref:Flagellin n=1 Tax=Halanaerobium congolense TaxID=54121 RepID=A0A1I0BNU7_9FIRM|nr:flagellin [Halanaerobium congolense]PTX16474.1 flagellin [Halanaerobium congolense]SDF78382.1 flagellin [Halanaerobium congolense]SET08697.1 flagellin [Halanaerobium congolense]SFP50602.1 flagellin [Halanaerobium congolense]